MRWESILKVFFLKSHLNAIYSANSLIYEKTYGIVPSKFLGLIPPKAK